MEPGPTLARVTRVIGIVRVTAVTWLPVLVAAPALAAEEAGASHTGDLLWQLLNLAILLAVLGYFARTPVQKFFAERRSRIRGDLDEAASLLAEAERRYSEWQHKLIDLDEELARIRADGRRRAEAERDAILADAQVAAERIHRNAVATVEQELRRAQSALRDEAAQLATELAERLLRERLRDGDRERLLDEFITRISAESGGVTRGRA